MSKKAPKTTKALSPPDADADLPQGWAAAKLGEICHVNPGKPSRHELPDDAAVSFVPMPAVDAELGTIASPQVRPAGEVRKGFTAFRDGDVIVAKITPSMENGKAAIARSLRNGFGFGSTEFHVLRPHHGVLAEYVLHFIRQPSFRAEAAMHMTGTAGQKRVPADFLRETAIPLPPLTEQRRIAEKLDQVGSRLAAARDRLTSIPIQLDLLRSAVITAACTGQLSTEWRTTQPTTENADFLLSQIARERIATIGKRRGRELSSEDITQADAESVSWEVPSSWTWCRLADLLHYQRSAAYGVLQPGKDVDSGIPFVRIGDLSHGTVQADALKRIAPSIDSRFPRTRLHGGEVLVSLVGTIGRTAVVPSSLKSANVARAIGVFPLCPHVQPDWVRIALDHPSKSRELVNLSREVARKTLNLGLLKAVKIPLPPKSEQVAIVRIATDLLSLIRKAELRAAAAAARIESLSDSTARAAFRGALVPTQAELARTTGGAFESGDALLERIRRQPVPRKAREQSSEEKPMVKSKDTPRDVLQRAVDAMPQQRFSFDDLRAKVTDDYDAIRDALFELLDTPHPGVKQVFDAKTKTMMLERVSK